MKEQNCSAHWFCVMGMVTILIGLGFGTDAEAQEVEVRNVQARQSGDTIVITYALDGDRDEEYQVELKASDDDGRSFSIDPKAVSGDVGNSVRSGEEKEIVWRVLNDYPGGLQGRGFKFKVIGRDQSLDVHLGITAGTSLMRHRGDEFPNRQSIEREMGLFAGGLVVVDFPGFFALQPELSYIQRGSSETYSDGTRFSFSNQYINLSALAKADLSLFGSSYTPSIVTGPSVGYEISSSAKSTGSNDVNLETNTLLTGFTAGLINEIHIGSIPFMIGIRYDITSSVYRDFQTRYQGFVFTSSVIF